ncbi:MAG: hypothetical protein HY556_11875 [Euryarchaeota archaeon]|nr:hypothetical protein [Euryarchaeota archaeon]
MVAPLLRRLEENLAPIFGRGMAPYVIRRALRRMNKNEESVVDREVDDLLRLIERESLERVYGAGAIPLAAEISMHVHRGTIIGADTVKTLKRGESALARARELL